ncbi:MAG: glycosyltransferase [Pseudomonadota bacterium]
MQPELSIIMPIIDRPETFGPAVEIALSQSLEDIEIILALSGDDVNISEIADDYKRQDSRIVVIKTPASPFKRTGAARHSAVDAARSDKILVLQDDDDWDEHHAAYMASLLDHGSLAVNQVRSVTLTGRETAWHPAFHLQANRQRAFASGNKGFYEAHYGFRRSLYQELDVRWDQMNRPNSGSSGLFVQHVFERAMAIDWVTGSEVTSWSLNSPPRRNAALGLSNADRNQERVAWRHRRSTSVVPAATWMERYLLYLMSHNRADQGYEATVSGIGLRAAGLEKGTVEDLELERFHSIYCLEDAGSPSDWLKQEIVGIFANLCESGRAMFLHVGALDHFWDQVGIPDDCAAIMAQAADHETGLRRALCLAYLGHYLVTSSRVDQANEAWHSAMAADARIAAIAAVVGCEIANASGQINLLEQLLAPFELSGKLPAPLKRYSGSPVRRK